MTALMAALANGLGLEVGEIHSRLSQPKRDRASDAFRTAAKGAVLFTSNVSARGVDYPDVTHVIQVECRLVATHVIQVECRLVATHVIHEECGRTSFKVAPLLSSGPMYHCHARVRCRRRRRLSD